jgi:hypothetical protein
LRTKVRNKITINKEKIKTNTNKNNTNRDSQHQWIQPFYWNVIKK